MDLLNAVNTAWPDDGRFRMFKSAYCGYCTAAAHLLSQKGLALEVFDLTGNDQARAALIARTGMRTVPQIWHGSHFVGGYSELVAYLQRKGL